MLRHKVVLIRGEGMGQGNEELGMLLLTNFLRMVGEKDAYVPRMIFLLNHGVKIACKGSPMLGHLTKLVEKGTNLVLCKTCLEYLELTDQVAVGKVGGMNDFIQEASQYEVVTV
jgi:hypothetical protein